MSDMIIRTPLKIGGITVPNRYAVAPMTMGDSAGADSAYTDNFITYIETRAEGGFGLIIPGALLPDSQVDPGGALGADPLSGKEAFLPQAKKLTAAVHAQGSRIFCQISMGLGRNYPGLYSCSPTPVFGFPDQKARVLTVEQIHAKIAQMVEFAEVAKEAGYDGVEVHAMHWGYLLDQFGTELFNQRTDEYGGSRENRLRAAKEIVEGIHEACGRDFPVSMRLSLKSYVKAPNVGSIDGEGEAGRTVEESFACAKLLEQYGYDMLNVDAGMYDSFYYACPPMYVEQSFMKPLLQGLKDTVSIPVYVGGRMNNPADAEAWLEEGLVDGISLGRPSLADPQLPNKVYAGTPEKIRPCLGCSLGCFNRLLAEGKPATCAVNPQANAENTRALKPLETKKKITVIGGGAAGMECARTAKIRGHEVELYEASDHLGGHLMEAGAHSFKKEILQLAAWYERELKELGVPVHTLTPVTKEMADSSDADVVVLATGSDPFVPKIPGVEKAIVSLEAIRHPEQLGQTVAVIGGGLVGCEIALDEAMKGKKVIVIEALDKILSSGVPAPLPNSMYIRDAFAKYGVEVHTSAKLAEVKDGSVVVSTAAGEEEILCDTAVLAIGFRPAAAVETAKEHYAIGDAEQAKTILNAVWTGYDLANRL